MEMTGEYKIPAPREKVWEALNDPEVLKKCIPGCQELNKDSDTELSAKVKSKVGPVSATFTGKVTLSDIDPPNGYTISGEGTGGVAGFAKGGAEVKLTEDGDGTLLAYTAKAQVGGKLAQIGSRLIDSRAKKMANEFFGKFAEEVGGSSGGAAEPAPAAAGAQPAPEPAPAAASTHAVPDPGEGHGTTPPGGTEARPSAPAPEESLNHPSEADAKTAAAVPGDMKEQAADAVAAKAEEIAKTGGGLSPAVWIGGVIAAVIVVLVLLNI